MELEALKASWSLLDERLATNEIVNRRAVKELIAQKTRSAYDRVVGLNIYSFAVNVLIAGVVFPLIFKHTPIALTSFVLVEAILAAGVVWQARKLALLSGFNLTDKKSSELSRLVLRYRKACHDESLWTIGGISLAMTGFYISELGFNKEAGYVLDQRILPVAGLTVLTLLLGYPFAQWQRRRHAQQLAEIEQGLEELEEFEN